MQESVNSLIQCGGVQVRPSDFVIADVNGVVFIPCEKAVEVLETAEILFEKELAMVKAVKSGESILEVDKKFNYEAMIKKDSGAG